MYKLILAVTVLLVGGWFLRPVERVLLEQRAPSGPSILGMDSSVRSELPQELAIGLLAGFRGLAADFIWIQGHGNWENKRWLRQYRNMRAATILQPRSLLFWEVSAWHMAYNIAKASRLDPENRSQAEGIKRQREWEERARRFLAEGVQYNPDRYDLYFWLGFLHWKKLNDPCTAKKYYQQALQFPDAPTFVLRQYALMIEKCDDPRQAYEYWKRLWRDGQPEPFPDAVDPHTVIPRQLRRLEETLKIPNDERLFPAVPSSQPGGST